MSTEKIKSCTFDKEVGADKKKLYKVTTESGLTGQAWEELKEGQEVNAVSKDYNGKPQYTFFPIKEKKAGFPVKDPKAEHKRTAQTNAVALICAGKAEFKDIIALSDKLNDWLNK